MGPQAINEDVELESTGVTHGSGQVLHLVIHQGVGGRMRFPPFSQQSWTQESTSLGTSPPPIPLSAGYSP